MKKRNFVTVVLLALAIAGFISVDAKATFTVATFSDPSGDSNSPLFEVDFAAMTLNGGWADTEIGLLLNVPYSANSFTNAWFEMTEVAIINTFGDTGGEIKFYADGDSTTPLLDITFGSGYVSRFNFGADEMFVANNVIITGSQIGGVLSAEEFSFAFANLAKLTGSSNWDDGFTATAAFTSSAIPEPATMGLLSIGFLSLIRRKK
ncbi:MAG: PEP-CTERM sorting domain-containing protein [Sedimentisphaerales bacterium]